MMATVDILAAAPKIHGPAGTDAGSTMCERNHLSHVY
jgi:hypothetical protein